MVNATTFTTLMKYPFTNSLMLHQPKKLMQNNVLICYVVLKGNAKKDFQLSQIFYAEFAF